MPLLSTVIPTFNRESLIRRTLDSVLAQHDDDQEVIVVDDGSTDGTLDIVAAYGERVTLLRQPNRGPGAARNVGLRHATGEYVAFLDSDDLWFPWTLTTYRQIIEQAGRPAFVAGRPFLFKTDADALPVEPEPLKLTAFDDYYASGDQWRWWSASSFVMRRDLLLAAGGFTDEWVNGEDADLAMRMGTGPGFLQVLEPYTFAYRQHAGSAMTNFERTFAGIMRMIGEEEAGGYPGGPSRRRERTRIISMYARPLCLEYQRRGDVKKSAALYRATLGWQMRLGRVKFLLAATAGFVPASLRTKRA